MVFRTRGAACAIALALVLAALPNVAGAQGSLMFDTKGTSDKPQSKLWVNNDAWWGCLNNSTKLAIYKLNGTTWTHKLDVTNAVLPFDKGGICDVLWDGTNLFVATYSATTPKLYKYSYDSMADTYTLLAGFPVNIPMLAGSETLVIDKDSLGRLWCTYRAGTKIYVTYTTSGNHTTWGAALALSGTINLDDISTVVAFAGNKVGVLWSDQVTHQVAFRWRNDGDAPTTWQAVEVVRSGFGVVDDHLNMKADTQGRVYFAAKDFFDGVWVGRRDVDGTWSVTTGASGLDCGTRPILQIDEASNKLYVFYTRWETCVSTGTHAIEERVAFLDNLLFSLPTIVIAANNISMNDVTGTKQVLPPGSLAVVCDGVGKAYWRGWGSVSGIGGTDPGGSFPPPPVAPTNIAAQVVTEATQPRQLLWKLDAASGTTAADASGNNRTGTLGSTALGFNPHWVPGLQGNGLFFDGDDYLSNSGSGTGYTNTSFTVEAWVNLDLTNSAGTGIIAHRGDILHNTFHFTINNPTLEFGWSTGDTTDTSVKATKNLADGGWHHLAAVWDRSNGEARIYVDGLRLANKSMGSPIYSDSWPLYVGGMLDAGFPQDNFGGTLDNFAVTNVALYSGSSFTPPFLYNATSTKYVRVTWTPPSSIAGIAGARLQRTVNGGTATNLNTAVTPNTWFPDLTPADGYCQYGVLAVDGLTQQGTLAWTPVSYEGTPPAVPGAPQSLAWTPGTALVDEAPFWELDEGSGNSTVDGSGLQHVAQFGTSPAIDSADPTWTNGISGRAIAFDGANDFAVTADALDLRFAGSFTVECWVRRAQTGTEAFLAKDEGSSKRNYMLAFTSGNQVEFVWRDVAGGNTRRATSTTTVTGTEWHHIAGVFDIGAHTTKVFIDGVEAGTASTAGTPYTGPEVLRFGARTSSSGGNSLSDPFEGDLDLVRVSSGVRYTAPFTPPLLYRGGAKHHTVQLSWAWPAAGFTNEFRLYRQQLPAGTNTLLATLPGTTFTYVDAAVTADVTYRYTVKSRNSSNVEGAASAPLDVVAPAPTDVAGDGAPAVPARGLRLEPNPFNPQATVRFGVERPGPVDLALYDSRGRRVHTVFHGVRPAGEWRVPVFAGQAPQLASGVYYLRLVAGAQAQTVKAVLVR